jgi:hypothetical protein
MIDNIPCDYLDRSQRSISIGAKEVECSAAKALNCSSPSFDVFVGECAYSDPSFYPDMAKCGPVCPKYKPSDIAICEKHGEHIAKDGCPSCARETINEDLFNNGDNGIVSMVRYVFIYIVAFIVLAGCFGFIQHLIKFNLSILYLILMLSPYLTIREFVLKHGRPLKPKEYRNILLGIALFLFFISLFFMLPFVMKDLIAGKIPSFTSFSNLIGFAIIFTGLFLLFPALMCSKLGIIKLFGNKLKGNH